MHWYPGISKGVQTNNHKKIVSISAVFFRACLILLSLFLLTGCQWSLEQLIAEMFADKTQWYVSTAGDDINPCHTAVNPCRKIATALLRAVAKDTIHVADGVYSEKLIFTKDVTLKGESEDNTIIDAEIMGGSVFLIDGSVNPGMQTLIFSDFTITGGTAGNGGGISAKHISYLNLTNIKIDLNVANSNGGGIYTDSVYWTILENVILSNNQAGTNGYGGGIYATGSPDYKLDISHSTISANQAVSGGGIACEITLNVIGSTIDSNKVTLGKGGGLLSRFNGAVVQSSIINNISDCGGDLCRGGGVANWGLPGSHATLSIVETTIDNNSAYLGGGIDNENGDGLSIISSVVSNNKTFSGGGVFGGGYNASLSVPPPPPDLSGGASSPVEVGPGGIYSINSTYSNNSGSIGGIETMNEFTGINLTIADNSGMGIFGENLLLTNVLLSNNSAGNCSDLFPIQAVTSMSNNDTCAGFIVVGDASIAPLGDNGGTTKTHRLLPNSPAIDSGSEVPGLYTDQRLSPRTLDGNGDGTAITDIGAYEAEFMVMPVMTFYPIDTPTRTPTPTSPLAKANPSFTPNINAYCRSGPDATFPSIGHAVAGQEFLVDGRDLEGTWFRIMLSASIGCWVPSDTGSLSVDPFSLRVLAAVETISPTVPLDCSSYTDPRSCGNQPTCKWYDPSPAIAGYCGNK